MSIEGGAFVCYTHDNFSTTDVKEWDKHCNETGHTLQIIQKCPECGTENRDDNYPYPKNYVRKAHEGTGQSIVLDCNNCKEALR